MSLVRRILQVLPCLAGALCIADSANAQGTPASKVPSSPSASAALFPVTAQVNGCSLTVATLKRTDTMTSQALVDGGVNDRGVSVGKMTTVRNTAKPGKAFITGKASLACKVLATESERAFTERLIEVMDSLVLSDGAASATSRGSLQWDYANRKATIDLFFSGLSATRPITGKFGAGTFAALPATRDN